jgi:hypothetical protein
MGIWYTTREDVASALDFKESARTRRLDRHIEAGSRAVESQLHRVFYPTVATRYKDWPNNQGSAPWVLRLDKDEIIALTSLVAGGVTIASSDYNLEPVNSGPPYTRIEIKLSSSAVFQAGDTHQRAIAMMGLFGYRNDEEPAGVLENAVASTSTTSIDVTDSAAIGVGQLIRIDNERMRVTSKSMLDTGQNIAGNLTASTSDVIVPVSNGAAYSLDEVILVDAERMQIQDISGNNLIVKRAYDGTVLASHTTGADVYAPRTLTVVRGAHGTTAATHSDATAIVKHVPPGLVQELCRAESINDFLQSSSGYARTIGSEGAERLVGGRGLADIRSQAFAAHGRKMRHRAV